MGFYEIGALLGQLLRYTSVKMALAVVFALVCFVMVYRLGNAALGLAQKFLDGFERKEQVLMTEIASGRAQAQVFVQGIVNECKEERKAHLEILQQLAASLTGVQASQAEILEIVKKHRDDDQRRAEGT